MLFPLLGLLEYEMTGALICSICTEIIRRVLRWLMESFPGQPICWSLFCLPGCWLYGVKKDALTWWTVRRLFTLIKLWLNMMIDSSVFCLEFRIMREAEHRSSRNECRIPRVRWSIHKFLLRMAVLPEPEIPRSWTEWIRVSFRFWVSSYGSGYTAHLCKL